MDEKDLTDGKTFFEKLKEDEFQRWAKELPWYRQYLDNYKENPDLDSPYYDYRKAWEGGAEPSINKADGLYHWPSTLPDGTMLKSDDHPTAWMQYFLEDTGIDPSGLARNPSKTELEFFKQRTDVGGMADFNSGTLVLNPYSKLSSKEKASVAINEYSRILMRENQIYPDFEMTPEQEKSLIGYGKDSDKRETIIGRIVSGDPSSLDYTPEQKKYADKVKRLMEGKR